MRSTLSALFVAGLSFGAVAGELDYRYYLSPSVGYTWHDESRLVEDGPEIALSFGRAVSDAYNIELTALYGLTDNVAGGDETDTLGLGLGLISFADRGRSPLYSLARVQWLQFDGHPGAEPDGVSLEGGLGLWFNTGNAGALRVEGGLRLSLHDEDGAGAGGKQIFNDTLVRVGYAIALGATPEPEAPSEQPVQVVEMASADSDGDGVVDDRDLCPGSAAGAEVDATGCAVFTLSEPKPARKGPGPGDYGYECRDPVPGEGVDQFGCAISKGVVLNQVNFEFDSAVLLDASKAVLDDVALALEASPGAMIEIGGHTSLEGDEFYNIDLSRRRAKAVIDYLVGQGVDGNRLRPQGYGSIRPVSSNESRVGRKENRRVEVKLLEK